MCIREVARLKRIDSGRKVALQESSRISAPSYRFIRVRLRTMTRSRSCQVRPLPVDRLGVCAPGVGDTRPLYRSRLFLLFQHYARAAWLVALRGVRFIGGLCFRRGTSGLLK